MCKVNLPWKQVACCAGIQSVLLFCYASYFCRFTSSIKFAKLEVQKQLQELPKNRRGEFKTKSLCFTLLVR